EAVRKKWSEYHQKEDFVFLGNGKHLPNIEAIGRLKNEIWPLIRNKLPQSKLGVYGAYMPESIKQMHAPKEGFHIIGHANDSGEVISNARLTLAPLSFGAGIKGKLL